MRESVYRRRKGTDQYIPGQIISKITGYVKSSDRGSHPGCYYRHGPDHRRFSILWSADGGGFTEIIGYFFTVIIGIEDYPYAFKAHARFRS